MSSNDLVAFTRVWCTFALVDSFLARGGYNMKHQSLTIFAGLLLAISSASLRGSATRSTITLPRPDNSRENALLVRQSLLTADAQPNDRRDCLTAAHIRRVIVRDDTLSTYAHNVKIIVSNGNVTLEGPVHSDDERQEIAFDAATIVGQSAILNKITLA